MIRFYKLVLTESPLDSPFVPKEKRWVAAAIAAAAAVAGSAMSSANTNSINNTQEDINKENLNFARETNELNAALQRETNAQNYRQFQEMNAFNLDMWNKQNAYNDPRRQVERLLAAGINPAGVAQTNLASSITSSQASPAQAAQMTAPRSQIDLRPTDFSGISNAGIAAVNAYNASRLMQAETKNKEALTANTAMDTTYKSKSMMDSIKYLQNVAKGSGWQAEMAKKQLDFIDATQQYDIQMKYGDMQMQQKSFERLEKEMRNMDLQNDILEIQKGYAKELGSAQIAQLWSTVHQANAQIGLINANALLTDEQRKHEIEKRVGTIIDNGMKGIDKRIKETTEKTIIQNEFNRGEMLDFERRNQKSGERFRRFQSLIPFTSPAAAKVLF